MFARETSAGRVNFFLTSGPSPRTNEVHFEIYKWQGGKFKPKSLTALPGDAIGEGEFATGYLLVDIHPEVNDTSVVLASTEDGSLIRRRFSFDLHDPLLTKFHSDIAAAVSERYGKAVSADNVRTLVEDKLRGTNSQFTATKQ